MHAGHQRETLILVLVPLALFLKVLFQAAHEVVDAGDQGTSARVRLAMKLGLLPLGVPIGFINRDVVESAMPAVGTAFVPFVDVHG